MQLDAARKPAIDQSLPQCRDVLRLRLDGDHTAGRADPICEADSEEADVGADIDDRAADRHEPPQCVDGPGLDALLVDLIGGMEGAPHERNAHHTTAGEQRVGCQSGTLHRLTEHD